ncbi:MAG: RNA methyltransferase [Verrucomicrobia bacterium]|nr:RNA methyltransferase [Verrucomicrobiota bacterium]MCG2795174.1 RNA methyltransferase [Actinomycetes bacterium]MCG2818342.1 RNA methyltransferase [Actinomycetes bacterium]
MTGRITSRSNDVVKRLRKFRRRSYRDENGVFAVEGVNLLQEAVGAGVTVRELVFVESRSGDADLIRSMQDEEVSSFEISDGLMDWISGVVTSQGIIGIMDQVDVPLGELEGGELLLLLIADQVRDPGNLGALMRITDAAGADGFVMTPGCVDMYNPKVVRSAAGAHFHMPCVRDIGMDDLRRALRRAGVLMLGLDPRGERCYLDVEWTEPCAVVVGNEAFGIAEEDRGLLDGTVHIEMPGRAESINVASAAAVVLFEAIRQRGTSSP